MTDSDKISKLKNKIIGLEKELAVVKDNFNTQEQQLRSIFDNTSIGFYKTTLDGKIIYTNPALLNILGYKTLDELRKINLNNKGYANPSKRKKFIAMFDDTDKIKGYETQWTKKDGTIRYIRENTRAIRNQEGEILFFEGTAEDISDRKSKETELINAKQKAEESDRLKSAFLANMSHEIRTPLNGILGFSQLLGFEDIEQEKKENFIDIIEQSSEQLLQIINDILDISKIEVGQINIFPQKISVNKLITDLFLFYKTVINKKSIDINIQIYNNKNYNIYTDKSRLTQIFSNLISNSLKFTEKGFINFGYKKQKNNFLFFVQDSGIGIAPDKKNIIYDRFRQSDETNIKKYGGTGLGLSISKGLTNLLGGKLWYESELGKGTVFYFSIPCKTKKTVS